MAEKYTALPSRTLFERFSIKYIDDAILKLETALQGVSCAWPILDFPLGEVQSDSQLLGITLYHFPLQLTNKTDFEMFLVDVSKKQSTLRISCAARKAGASAYLFYGSDKALRLVPGEVQTIPISATTPNMDVVVASPGFTRRSTYRICLTFVTPAE